MTTQMNETKYKDRLLDALLVEFDAPVEVRIEAGTLPDELALARGSRGPTPSRSTRTAMWVGSAAALALLAGAVWAVTGGLDADRTPISVASAPTTVVDPPYLEFADMSAASSSPTKPLNVANPAGEQPVPGADGVIFRPRDGGAARPILRVWTPNIWHATGGEERTTPGGIVVHGEPLWSDPSGPWASVRWEAADGAVRSVQQDPQSSRSFQKLDLVSTDELLAFVDGLTFDGSTVSQADDSYERRAHDPNTFDTSSGDLIWSLQTPTLVDMTSSIYGLSAHRGVTDLANVAGTPVEVRGTTGVVGTTSTPIDGATAIVWNEGGATMILSASAKLDRIPTVDQMVEMANGLREVSKADFDAIRPTEVGDPMVGLSLDIPENDGVDVTLRAQFLDAAGNVVGFQPTTGMMYGGPSPRRVDLMMPAGTATVKLWMGSSETPPACAAPIDVSGATAGQANATLDLDCT